MKKNKTKSGKITHLRQQTKGAKHNQEELARRVEERAVQLAEANATLKEQIAACQQTRAEQELLLATEREQRLLADTMGEVFLALAAQTRHKAVLDEILRQVQRVVAHSAANLTLLEGTALRLVRWQGYQTLDSENLVTALEQLLVDFSLYVAEVIETRRPLVIPDTHRHSQWVSRPETEWIRSCVAVPICVPDRILGLLRLDSDTPDKFSTQDVEHLQLVANAAAIALENARLYDQARWEIAKGVIQAETEIIQLNRQLLTLQYAGTTTTPNSDLPSVLNAITEEMTNLLKVESCAIFEWDQVAQAVSVLARYGLEHCWAEGSLVEWHRLADCALAERVLVEQRPQQMTISHLDPANTTCMQQAKLKTLLMVPMEFQDHVLGLVKVMDSREERIFTNREIALVQVLANQAASAIEHTRLYAQVQQEITEQAQTEQELRQIVAKDQVILQAITDSIFYFSHDGQLLDYKLVAGDKLPPEILGEIAIGQHLDDTLRLPPDWVNLTLRYIGKALDTDTMQVFEYQLPLPQETRDFETQVVASGPDEVLIMMRDITERKARTAALERERAHVTRNLHDNLGQSLAYLHLKLDQLVNSGVLQPLEEVRQELEQMRNVSNEAYEQVRRLLAASRPHNSTDLATALLVQARSVGQQANFKVHLTSHGPASTLSPVVQQQVLYFFQEALTNVAKHAKAQQVGIDLLWSEAALTIKLSDDGQGFDPEIIQPDGHFGLMLMRERVREINGRLTLTSNPAAGTNLTLWLPLDLVV